ncbi:MAG: hypothetical protein K2X81_17975, partial [Candidatus Obscuribacterales bacterium]|nr:hypothetical protein [Candidatus Obscuribacterales bacterium]
ALDFDKSIAPDTTIGTASQLEFSIASSIPEFQIEPDTVDKNIRKEISALLKGDRKMQLFGHACDHFQKLQEISAFASNGISWSPQRREDSCYSHLVDASKDWQLLWKIDSLPELGLDLNDKSLFLLIRSEDLERQNYDKAFLLID